MKWLKIHGLAKFLLLCVQPSYLTSDNQKLGAHCKMKKTKYLLCLLAVLSIVGWGPFSVFESPVHEHLGTKPWVDHQARLIKAQADNIDSNVLKLSLNAYVKAKQHGFIGKQLLTIIDYSIPSSERRLWVVDLRSGKVLYNTWVSHGKNSGNVMATSFSNSPGSLKSSIGVFQTKEPYMGGNGYSLRLRGLEQGINDNAYRRDIVVHGAWYVGSEVARKYGQLGRSWGCPAVSDSIAKPLIDTIKDNSLVVAYYPDSHWLRSSTFLAG